MPHDAERIIFGFASSIRVASSFEREAAEDDRVNRAEPRAGEHREDRFGHARHVDDDAVALLEAERAQRAGEPRHFVAQLGVGERPDDAGDRAVVDDRALLAAAALDVAIDARCSRCSASPPANHRTNGRAAIVEHAVPSPAPGNALGRLGPERLPDPRGSVDTRGVVAGAHRSVDRSSRFVRMRTFRFAASVRPRMIVQTSS